MVCAEGVLEACVGCAGVNQVREAELAYVSESLKDFRVDELKCQLIDPDVVP